MHVRVKKLFYRCI